MEGKLTPTTILYNTCILSQSTFPRTHSSQQSPRPSCTTFIKLSINIRSSYIINSTVYNTVNVHRLYTCDEMKILCFYLQNIGKPCLLTMTNFAGKLYSPSFPTGMGMKSVYPFLPTFTS